MIQVRKFPALGAVALLCITSLAAGAQALHTHALLIGAHAYQHHDPNRYEAFADLNTESDVQAIREVLVDHCKFSSSKEDMVVLTSKADTSRASIQQAFEALIAKTHEGDIVYIHYSGHGSQAPDPSEPSGFDQTMVPTDYADNGSKDLKDKQIAKWIAAIKAKKPSSLTLTFDCCHSGSITRGGMLVRGKDWADRFPKGQAPATPAPASAPDVAPVSGQTALEHDFVTQQGLRGNPTDWGYTALSACRDDQTAAEMLDDAHQPMGRLSYALVNALRASGPQTTYRSLFEQIDSLTRQRFTDHDQSPQLEGDRDKLLFSGITLAPQRYIPTNLDPKGKIILHAGSLQGMTVKSLFALYPHDATVFTDTNKIAEAQLTNRGVTESILEVTRKIKAGLKPGELDAARAVETVHQYGDNRVKVDPADFHGLAQEKAILDQLKTLDAVTMDLQPGQKPDVRLKRLNSENTGPRGSGPLALVREDGGSTLTELTEDDTLPVQIQEALKREAKWRLVRALNSGGAGAAFQLQMRIVPAAVDDSSPDDIKFKSDKTAPSGTLLLSDGDYTTIEVQNVGDTPVHVAVLDIESDATVKQIWPDPTLTDNIVQPKTGWHKLWTPNGPAEPQLYHMSRPYGTEIFKAVATKDRADFTALETRGARGPLELLFQVMDEGKRADAVKAPTDWATATVAFEVQAPPSK